MATRHLVYQGSLNGTGQIFREYQVNINQTITRGDYVILSSNKASIGTDAPAANTVLGVSNTDIVTGGTVTAADVIKVDINPASIYRSHYIGTGTVAVGTLFDMGAAAYEFDSDDTTGGFIQVVDHEIDTTLKEANVLLTSRVFGVL